jgi:NAD(P)-dependent dehydrogenase (short-subunit alcohol dehydrogenase family)
VTSLDGQVAIVTGTSSGLGRRFAEVLDGAGARVVLGNVKDHAHEACLLLLRHAEGPLLVPSPVLGEIGYLLQSRVGPQAEVTFLRSFDGDGFKNRLNSAFGSRRAA